MIDWTFQKGRLCCIGVKQVNFPILLLAAAASVALVRHVFKANSLFVSFWRGAEWISLALESILLGHICFKKSQPTLVDFDFENLQKQK